jgi:hypothetical protein
VLVLFMRMNNTDVISSEVVRGSRTHDGSPSNVTFCNKRRRGGERPELLDLAATPSLADLLARGCAVLSGRTTGPGP